MIVTGAPGAGKSSVADILLSHEHEWVVFDVDWLAEAASDLAGRNIITDGTTWKPYRGLWLTILDMVAKNNRKSVLFANISKEDIAEVGERWPGRIKWCLLDCDDATRRLRLADSPGSTDAVVATALQDAARLRDQLREVLIDTSHLSVRDVAAKVAQFAGSSAT